MKTLLICSLTILASACLPGKTALKFGELKPVVQSQKPEAASKFETLKNKVLAPKCLGCHAKWSDEIAFQGKLELGHPEKTKLFVMVEKGEMPVGPKKPDGTRESVPPLSSEELELIRDYILTTTVSFATLKEKVLDQKCLTCHKRWPTEEAFGMTLTPGAPETSKSYIQVAEKKMPKAPKNEDGTPGAVVPLPKPEMQLLKNYISTLKTP